LRARAGRGRVSREAGGGQSRGRHPRGRGGRRDGHPRRARRSNRARGAAQPAAGRSGAPDQARRRGAAARHRALQRGPSRRGRGARVRRGARGGRPVSPARERALRMALRTVALGLGVVAAFAGRNAINADGISYLDIGDAYARGDWRIALSAYWSPLYSWLLGSALAVLSPSAYWEFPLVHLVNVVLFAVALVCFEVFLRALWDWRRTAAGPSPAPGSAAWTWWLWGYAVFLPASLWMVTLRLVTPDLLVLGAVLLTAALLARVAVGRVSSATFIGLGLVLG